MTWLQLTENDCHEWKLNVQQSIPKKGTTRNQVQDLVFMQLASYLQANVTQICVDSFFDTKNILLTAVLYIYDGHN